VGQRRFVLYGVRALQWVKRPLRVLSDRVSGEIEDERRG
jgi:hypothetical protein